MFFSLNSNYSVGIDISDYNLKIVQLNKKGEKIGLQALSARELEDGLIENGEIKNCDKISTIIKNIFSNPNFGDFTSSEVSFSLPEDKTFTKYLTMEKTINPIRDVIYSEMEKYIPLPLDEMYIDWQIIAEKNNQQEIYFVAVPKKIVDKYIELAGLAGLSIYSIEPESISAARCFLVSENPTSKIHDKKNYFILDLGESRSNLAAYANNSIVFTISLPITGRQVTKKIAETLKIDTGKAEKAKIICGLNKDAADGAINSILSEMITELSTKISDAISFYDEHFAQCGKIDKILLSGGGAKIKNLASLIYQSAGIDTAIADPLANLQIKPEEYYKVLAEKFYKEKKYFPRHLIREITPSSPDPTFAVPIGLALRGIYLDKF